MQAFWHAADEFFGHLAAVDFRALGMAALFQVLRVVVRTRAWRNIIAAAYPGTRVRWRSVLGAYLGGVGLNAITPARSGDVLKLYLVKHRVAGSTYPTLAATLVVETLFDALVGVALLLWVIHLGALPSLNAIPDLPSIDWAWPLQHPREAEIAALLLGIVLGVLLVIATRRVRAFWQRVAQGFAIVREPRVYLTRVVPWQASSWVFRFATVFWLLRAFHVPASIHNALLVQLAQSMSTVLPITPGGAGTEQGLLLYLFRGTVGRTTLLSFSVGMHITIVVINVLLGLAAIALMTRSLRFRKLRRDASRDGEVLEGSNEDPSINPERAEVGDRIPRPPAL